MSAKHGFLRRIQTSANGVQGPWYSVQTTLRGVQGALLAIQGCMRAGHTASSSKHGPREGAQSLRLGVPSPLNRAQTSLRGPHAPARARSSGRAGRMLPCPCRPSSPLMDAMDSMDSMDSLPGPLLSQNAKRLEKTISPEKYPRRGFFRSAERRVLATGNKPAPFQGRPGGGIDPNPARDRRSRKGHRRRRIRKVSYSRKIRGFCLRLIRFTFI